MPDPSFTGMVKAMRDPLILQQWKPVIAQV